MYVLLISDQIIGTPLLNIIKLKWQITAQIVHISHLPATLNCQDLIHSFTEQNTKAARNVYYYNNSEKFNTIST